MQASFEPTDLAAFTADLASDVPLGDRARGPALEVDCAPLPEPVYVDRDMWEKIVLNLLSNAFKFTFEGAIAVTLRDAGRPRRARPSRDTGHRHRRGRAAAALRALPPRRGRASRTHEGIGHRPRARAGAGAAARRRHRGGERARAAGTTFRVTLPNGLDAPADDRISRRARRPARGRTRGTVRRGSAALAAGCETAGPTASRSAVDADAPRGRARAAVGPHPVADDNADMREYLTRLLAHALECRDGRPTARRRSQPRRRARRPISSSPTS